MIVGRGFPDLVINHFFRIDEDEECSGEGLSSTTGILTGEACLAIMGTLTRCEEPEG